MAKQQNVISHWYQLIENFHTSTLTFYESVELAIQRREVPDIQTSREDFKEGGLLTAKREYLRIVRGKFTFDICGAPFGTGFFFSWWLTETPASYGILYLFGLLFFIGFLSLQFLSLDFSTGILFIFIGIPLGLWYFGKLARNGILDCEDTILAIPFIGSLYERIFAPATYYKIDTALMFQQSVHNAVLEVIDQITSTKGVRALSEAERKPILVKYSQSA